jgi:exopolysaccharide biosynthesis protein
MRRSGSALLAVVLLAALLPTGSFAASPSAPVTPAHTVTPFTANLTEPIAPGVVHRVGDWTTTNGDQAVQLIDVDPQADGIGIEASVPVYGVHSLQTVSGQAARLSAEGHRVVAAVNGDTWNTDAASTRLAPTGILVHEGELMTGSTTAKPTIGFDAAETAMTADVAVGMTVALPDGVTTLSVDKINKPRTAGSLVAYTRRWGTTSLTIAGGTEVVLTGVALPLRLSGTWTGTVAAVLPTGSNTRIPFGGVVLSAQGVEAPILAALTVGATITMTTSVNAGWENVQEALSGREWLARDGVAGVSPVTAPSIFAHPRTAVGVRADGTIVLAIVDGRQPPYSTGVLAADLADMLVADGVVSAINLDGGGSTTMLARVPGDVSATVVNSPSDGTQRAVDNALLIVSTTPTGPLSQVYVRPGITTAVVGQVVPFTAKGSDAAGNGVAVAPASVTWTLDGASGSLVGGGRFAAAAPGSATVSAAVTAQADATAGSAAITVIPDTMAPVPAAPIATIVAKSIAAPGAVSVSVAWAAATDVGTGVASYELEQRVGVGAWTPVPLPTPLSRAVTVALVPGDAVEFHVRATDNAANVSAFKSGGVFQVRLDSERLVTFARTWYTRTKSSYLDGGMRSTRTYGATATYSFTGSAIAWIAPTGLTAGSAKVEIDGKVVATVSLRSTAGVARKVVFSKSWSSIGRHKIVVRALATPGHPWVSVDGFAVIDVASSYPTLSGAGDIGVCGSTWDSATAALIDKTPGTVFTAGDDAYPAGTAAQFRTCYGPSWGYFKKRTMPTPGNHEYGTAGAAPYFAYFGARAGTPGQGWYAYNVGTWRVYALNANCGAVGGCGTGSPQEQWLKADLAAHPTACIAAIWHQPLFSSGPHGNNSSTKAFWQDLYAAGAEIVINGHDHDYERFAPQKPDGTLDTATGIREFVVGTGGAGLYSLTTLKANSEVFKTGVHGIIKFTLLDGSYTWKFVPVAGSTWTDSGTGTCH